MSVGVVLSRPEVDDVVLGQFKPSNTESELLTEQVGADLSFDAKRLSTS